MPPRPLLNRLGAVFALLVLALPAWAQDLPGFGFPTEKEVAVTAEPSTERVPPSGELVIAVVLRFAEGWHAWPSAEQDVLPKEIAEFAYRTEVELVDLHGLPVATAPVQWPELHDTQVPNFSDFTGENPTVTVPTYGGTAIAYIPVRVNADAPPGQLTLTVRAFYQACNASTCIQPEDVRLPVTLTIDPDARAAIPADGLFAALQRATLAGLGDAPTTLPPPDAPAGGQAQSDAPLAQPTADRTILALFLLACLGGVVLNIMPCVLPVIPIKIMTLARHAQESRARTVFLGLWMAIGVAAFWIGVGVPVAISANTLDPSAIFSVWPFTLAMGVVIVLMGLGIMGLFTFNLPQKAYMFNPKADSAWGSFLFGVMTALLGLPCFGPIVGGLLVGGATLPPAHVMTVFTGLGVGMAAPYLILSMFPALVRKLPQSGPSGELVKQVMGLIMLAAGLYFAANGVKTLLKQHPYLGAEFEWVAAAILVVAAGLWLIARAHTAAKSTPARAVLMVLGLGISVTSVLAVRGLIDKAHDEWRDREAAIAQAETGAVPPGVWLEFTPSRLQRALDQDKTVFLDFTADWCITCKAWKARRLDQEPVASRLRQGDVVILEADFDEPAVKAFLRDEVGRTGIPVWAIYSPDNRVARVVPEGSDPIKTPEASTVTRMLDEAAGRPDPGAAVTAGDPTLPSKHAGSLD